MIRRVQVGQSVRSGHIHECAVGTCVPPISGAAAEALADHEARRPAEDLRGLLGRVADEVEDLPPSCARRSNGRCADAGDRYARVLVSHPPTIRRCTTLGGRAQAEHRVRATPAARSVSSNRACPRRPKPRRAVPTSCTRLSTTASAA
jgi:hypothetical protein